MLDTHVNIAPDTAPGDPGPPVRVVHLAGDDRPWSRADVLGDRMADLHLGPTPTFVHVGPGPAWHPGARRIHAPFELPPLGARALRRALTPDSRPGRLLLHAWSRRAAQWCAPLAAAGVPLVIDVSSADDPASFVVWPTSGRLAHTPTYACESDAAQKRLCQQGVPLARCCLVPPGADVAEDAAARRAMMRARLRLGTDEPVLAVLPPADRKTGALTAVWGGMLAHEVRSDLRMLVPVTGGEGRRMRTLVAACRNDAMVRFAADDVSLTDFLSAVDLALYVPRRDAPLGSVVAALRAGCPLITTPLPSVLELASDREMTHTCGGSTPEHVAHAILTVLGDWAGAQTRARAVRAASTLRTLDATVARYHACYAAAVRREAAH
jgi:hypothetical protein